MQPGRLLHLLMRRPMPDFNQGDRQAIEYAAMNAVMNIERRLGFIPKDVSAQKIGYDVESEIPREMQNGEACLRFIEVKGRAKGANTVTVSKNEMLYALNTPNEFILAIVEVDGTNTRTVYLKTPFQGMDKPTFAEVSRNFCIDDLICNGQVVYDQ